MKFEYTTKVDEPVLSLGYLVEQGDVVEVEDTSTMAAKLANNVNWKVADDKANVTAELHSDPDADELSEQLKKANAKLADAQDKIAELEQQLEQAQNRKPSRKKVAKKRSKRVD